MPIELTAVFLERDEGYIGFVEEIPTIEADGDSLDEVRQKLHAAAESFFAANMRTSRRETAGNEVIREPLRISGNSSS